MPQDLDRDDGEQRIQTDVVGRVPMPELVARHRRQRMAPIVDHARPGRLEREVAPLELRLDQAGSRSLGTASSRFSFPVGQRAEHHHCERGGSGGLDLVGGRTWWAPAKFVDLTRLPVELSVLCA